MGLVTSNKWVGFQEYDSEDPEIVFKHPLTTDKDTVDLGTATMTEIGTGTVTYDANEGVSLTNGGNPVTDNAYIRVQLTNAADYQPLTNAGCVTFWLSNADLFEVDNIKTYNDYIISWDNSAGQRGYLYRIGSNGRIATWFSDTVSSTFAKMKSLNKAVPVRVDLSWTNGHQDIYIDYKLVLTDSHTEMVVDNWDDIGIGHRGNSNSFEGVSMKNLMISHRPIMLPVHPKLQRVIVFGDSFPKAGNYPASEYAQIGEQEDGLTGIEYDPATVIYDGGMMPACEKELNKAGYAVGGGKIVSYTHGGAGIEVVGNALSDRIDEMIATQNPAPTMALIHICTNDTTSLSVDIDDTWRASYQTEIDRLIDLGCSHIVIMTAPPVNVETTFDTAVYKARDLAVNAQIRQLDVENAEVTVIDQFNLFGGHDNFNPADFGTANGTSDDRHPSWYGYEKIGKWFAQGIVKRLT